MERRVGVVAYPERVEDPEQLPAALERAPANAPALLDVLVTREAVSSDAQKGLSTVPDYQALTTWDEAERQRQG
jgi:acetolactate synthase-1/2/3 large subunit